MAKPSYAARLVRARKRRGWTQIQCAAYLTRTTGETITQVRLSGWENGHRKIPVPELIIKAIRNGKWKLKRK